MIYYKHCLDCKLSCLFYCCFYRTGGLRYNIRDVHLATSPMHEGKSHQTIFKGLKAGPRVFILKLYPSFIFIFLKFQEPYLFKRIACTGNLCITPNQLVQILLKAYHTSSLGEAESIVDLLYIYIYIYITFPTFVSLFRQLEFWEEVRFLSVCHNLFVYAGYFSSNIWP